MGLFENEKKKQGVADAKGRKEGAEGMGEEVV